MHTYLHRIAFNKCNKYKHLFFQLKLLVTNEKSDVSLIYNTTIATTIFCHDQCTFIINDSHFSVAYMKKEIIK